MLGVTLLPKDVVLIALAGLAAVALVGWLFKKDTAIEHRRRDVIQVAAKLSRLGWDRLAAIAEAYAVGDYSGVYLELKTLLRDMSNAETAMSMVGDAVCRALPELLEADGYREKILKAVSNYEITHSVSSTAKK